MKKERIIEILIIIFLLTAGAFVLNKAYYNTFVKPNLYTITFSDIDSIIKGSPVRFMGIIIGHVRNLKRQDENILCEIIVTKQGVKIPDGAVAKVAFNGIAGSKSIEIMPPETDDGSKKGIIAAQALRINDIMDASKSLKEVLMCVKGFIDGITPENAMNTAKAISSMEDLGGVDKSLDEIISGQERAKEKFTKVNKFQKELDELLRALQRK